MCKNTSVYVCIHDLVWVVVRGQIARSFLLLPCGSWILNSDHQPCWQVALAAEPPVPSLILIFWDRVGGLSLTSSISPPPPSCTRKPSAYPPARLAGQKAPLCASLRYGYSCVTSVTCSEQRKSFLRACLVGQLSHHGFLNGLFLLLNSFLSYNTLFRLFQASVSGNALDLF